MDANVIGETESYLGASSVAIGKNLLTSQNNLIKHLLTQRKMPDKGWKNRSIEALLNMLATLDSNNIIKFAGLGEREGRVYSELVSQRHYHMSHGIGRSGDLTSIQPKAVGSSMMNQLVNALILDTLKSLGMSLTLCFLTLRWRKPKAKYIIWSRIDQKACFKSMLTAGYEPVILQLDHNGDSLTLSPEKVSKCIEEIGHDNILCVMTTTSCFAPRSPDPLPEIAKICQHYNVAHIVNNAYGLQSFKCIQLIQDASREGRVDAFVQSTDKNFQVPVGGAIIAGCDCKFIQEVSEMYPGRASASPSLDMLITLLSMGKEGYRNELNKRRDNFQLLKKQLQECSTEWGGRLLLADNNISLAYSLPQSSNLSSRLYTSLGSMLFHRGITGCRVVTGMDDKTISGHQFKGWGSHTDACPGPYLTSAIAVGLNSEEIGIFIKKLSEVIKKSNVATKVE